MENDTVIEQAYEQVKKGFPVRLVAHKLRLDYRELFKLLKKRGYKSDYNYDYFISWLLEKESDEFKAEFNNLIEKVDFKKLVVVPQYLFISIYIFLKNKEDEHNRINGLLYAFNISPPTWRKYKHEIIKTQVIK